MSQIPPARAHRTVLQRLVIAVNCVLIAGFLAVAAGLAYGYERYASIPRIGLGQVLATDADDELPDDARNYLVVGADSAEGLDADDPVARSRTAVAGARTDTMMVLRVDPATTRASLLSLPRDLYVPLAGRRGSDRLNAAIQYGGPDLLVDTIEEYLGIPVHHYVQVDFAGFVKLVDVVGGVPMRFDHPTRDLRSGLAVDAGCVTLDGAQALGFVRSRAYQEQIRGRWRTDPTGDLGRISRQQAFVVAALERVFARGARNPVTLDRLVDRGVEVVTLDDTLEAEELVRLALRFRSFHPSALDLHELPVTNATVGGASVLRLQEQAAAPTLDLFRAPSGEEPDPSTVRVRVLNGTGEPGLAGDVAAELIEAGFASGGVGDADRLGLRRSELRFPAGVERAAVLVARFARESVRLVEDDDVTGLTLVVGTGWNGLRDEPRPAEEIRVPDATSTTTSAPEGASSPTVASGDEDGSETGDDRPGYSC